MNKDRMSNKLISAAVASAVCLGVTGCISDDDKEDIETQAKVQLSAMLSSAGYNVAAKPTLSERMLAFFVGEKVVAAGDTVDQVWAVPVGYYGSQAIAQWDEKVVGNIGSDGSFSLEVSPDFDWLLFLVNSQAAARKDRLVSYVSIKDATDQVSLLVQPISAIEGDDDVDYGELAPGTGADDTDEAQTQFSTEAEEEAFYTPFTMTTDELMEMATVDDTFKALKNEYINRSAAGTAEDTFLAMTFEWRFGQDLLTGTQTDGSPNAHPGGTGVDLTDTDGSDYMGYWIYSGTTRTVDTDAVCALNGATKRLYRIALPDGASLNVVDEYGTNPATYTAIDNDRTMVEVTDGAASQACWDSSGTIGVSQQDHYDNTPYVDFGLGSNHYVQGAVPAGWWTFSYDDDGNGTLDADEAFAWFDVKSAYPFDSNGNPTVYVPAPTVTTDAGGRISSVAVKWYRWNSGTGAWVEADPDVMAKFINTYRVELKDFEHDDPATTTVESAQASATADAAPSVTSISVSEFSDSGWSDTPIPDGTLWDFDATDATHASDQTFDAQVITVSYTLGGNEYHFDYQSMWTQ